MYLLVLPLTRWIYFFSSLLTFTCSGHSTHNFAKCCYISTESIKRETQTNKKLGHSTWTQVISIRRGKERKQKIRSMVALIHCKVLSQRRSTNCARAYNLGERGAGFTRRGRKRRKEDQVEKMITVKVGAAQ